MGQDVICAQRENRFDMGEMVGPAVSNVVLLACNVTEERKLLADGLMSFDTDVRAFTVMAWHPEPVL